MFNGQCLRSVPRCAAMQHSHKGKAVLCAPSHAASMPACLLHLNNSPPEQFVGYKSSAYMTHSHAGRVLLSAVVLAAAGIHCCGSPCRGHRARSAARPCCCASCAAAAAPTSPAAPPCCWRLVRTREQLLPGSPLRQAPTPTN